MCNNHIKKKNKKKNMDKSGFIFLKNSFPCLGPMFQIDGLRDFPNVARWNLFVFCLEPLKSLFKSDGSLSILETEIL